MPMWPGFQTRSPGCASEREIARTRRGLLARGAGQADADLREHVLRVAGAVEALPGWCRRSGTGCPRNGRRRSSCWTATRRGCPGRAERAPRTARPAPTTGRTTGFGFGLGVALATVALASVTLASAGAFRAVLETASSAPALPAPVEVMASGSPASGAASAAVTPMETTRPDEAAITAVRRPTVPAFAVTDSAMVDRGVFARTAARCRPLMRLDKTWTSLDAYEVSCRVRVGGRSPGQVQLDCRWTRLNPKVPALRSLDHRAGTASRGSPAPVMRRSDGPQGGDRVRRTA